MLVVKNQINDKVEKKYIKTKNELNVFKKTFFKKIKLKYIVLCEKLKVGELMLLVLLTQKWKQFY